MVWDVAIIGSGPAGSAMAIHCRNAGLRTAVFSTPRTLHSDPAPETLPVTVRPLLDALGISTATGLRPLYALSSAWGSDSLTTRHSICNPLGPGWFVDRTVFDAALEQRAISAGAVPFTARLISASREQDAWRLRFRMPGASDPISKQAFLVIDATGRASAFARRIGILRTAFDRLVCITARANPCGSVAGEGLVESAPDGWWFSAPSPNGELSVSWFTEAGLLRPMDRCLAAFDARLRQTTYTRARVSSLLPCKLNFRSASTGRLQTFSGDDWVAIGDAAVACDPLGSQGLTRALESAAMAFRQIVKNRTSDPGNAVVYSEFLLDFVEQFLGERHYYYSTERRWPDAPFWRTQR